MRSDQEFLISIDTKSHREVEASSESHHQFNHSPDHQSAHMQRLAASRSYQALQRPKKDGNPEVKSANNKATQYRGPSKKP